MTVSVSLHRGCESPKVRKLRPGFMPGERSSKPLGSEFRSLNEGGNLGSCLAGRVRNPSDTSSDVEEVSQGFRTPRAEDETQIAKRYPKGSKFPRIPFCDLRLDFCPGGSEPLGYLLRVGGSIRKVPNPVR